MRDVQIATLRQRLTEVHCERLREILDDIEEDEKRPDEEKSHLLEFLHPLLKKVHDAIEKAKK